MIASCLACLAGTAHAGEAKRATQQAAPTQPVYTNTLEAPVFQSDTRNLEAILGKEEEARITRDGASPVPPAAGKQGKPMPAQAPEAADMENGDPVSAAIMSVRVFAIRWRDVFEIIFAGTIALYVRKLYQLSRDQQKVLSHTIRSAEYAAAAAKRSAEICENLLKHQNKPDEAQGKLDLDIR
jgi:hypothetical protein